MIAQRTRGLLTALVLCQATLVVVLFAAVAQFTFTFITEVTRELLPRYFIYAAVVVAGLVVEALSRERLGSRMNSFHQRFGDRHRITLRQTCFAAAALLVWLALLKDQTISRSFLVIYLPLLYLTLLASNWFLPNRLARGIFGGVHEERTLLIGSPRNAGRLKEWLTNKEMLGFKAIGILSTDPSPETGDTPLQVIGTPDDLEQIVSAERITQVILLELPEAQARHRDLVVSVEKLGVRLLILSNLEEWLGHPVVHVEDGGFRFITLREEPLENPLNRLLKRGLDLAVSIPIVIFVLPILSFTVWLVHRWQSPGLLFYRQTRAGIQNRQFQIIKFRTMHPGNPDETRQAVRDDERIFAAGRWLRRLSLDELPQFLNVLRGEMSVTGPRPHLVEHNAQFARQMANYHIRTFVKPGITGLAQVRGFRGEARSSDEIAKRLASDISYLENWRLALDVSIIARTVWQMLQPPPTAY